MIDRMRLVRRLTAFALLGAIHLFAAESTRGVTHMDSDTGTSHAHHQSESPQAPAHPHSPVGDHCAHSHILTFTSSSQGLAFLAPVLAEFVGYTVSVTCPDPHKIEHPPRS